MKTTKNRWIVRTAALAVMVASISQLQAGDEEGGYVGTLSEGHDTVAYNFIKHWSYEQYYYSAEHQWTWNNDNRIDNMDIALFAGHGNTWLIQGQDGVSVDLSDAGDTSDDGYGDLDCEFVAFESCYVVPSPIEESDWYTPWTNGNGVFDGLHQAVGFRTVSYQSTDQKVSNYFGNHVEHGDEIWATWFNAINAKALASEKGSAVMHPSCDGDTYYSFAPDPSPTSGSLRVWYQL